MPVPRLLVSFALTAVVVAAPHAATPPSGSAPAASVSASSAAAAASWPNVLSPKDTWLFDHGSNFGWAAKETSGGKHSFSGPAPDWSLGNRAVPNLEFDVELHSSVEAPAPPLTAGGGNFAATPCKEGSATQLWTLSPGVVPGNSTPTNVKLGPATGKGGCWEIEACATGEGAAVNCNYGCKALPTKGCGSACDCNGAWSTNKNGTITSVMDGKCLQVSAGPGSVVLRIADFSFHLLD